MNNNNKKASRHCKIMTFVQQLISILKLYFSYIYNIYTDNGTKYDPILGKLSFLFAVNLK